MIFTAPQSIADHRRYAIFIAGGISNCEDWQEPLTRLFDADRYDVFNPRRPGGLEKDGEEARRQIEWEFRALHASRTILFWFPPTSICPITLFEYGAALERAARGECRVIAGWDQAYERAFDLRIQTKLVLENSPAAEVLLVGDLDQLRAKIAELYGPNTV